MLVYLGGYRECRCFTRCKAYVGLLCCVRDDRKGKGGGWMELMKVRGLVGSWRVEGVILFPTSELTNVETTVDTCLHDTGSFFANIKS